ncbi:MAG: hypothetical protein R3B06_04080 [Kofleriaceae bacterium]
MPARFGWLTATVTATAMILGTGIARAERPAPAPPVDDDPVAYAAWRAALAPADRRAVERRCAAEPLEVQAECGGIGPLAIPPPPPRSDAAAWTAWQAALSPAQRRGFERACARPAAAFSTLCAYELPPAPAPGQTYRAWRAALAKPLRQAIDARCAAMTVDTDEYCDGIGPLHLPIPPDGGGPVPGQRGPVDRKAMQAAWDRWYRALSPAQRRYYRRVCSGAAAPEISELCGGTPLVVVFDDAPVTFEPVAAGAPPFRFYPGADLYLDWPTARTPWLALDRDGDGTITDGSELFGSATTLAAGGLAPDGFAALAELDANRDGVLDADDPGFAALLLWSDVDRDRRASPGELVPLAARVKAISLAWTVRPRCDARANCERERATATTVGGAAGAVVDVHLLVRPTP